MKHAMIYLVLFDYFTCKFLFCFVSLYFALEVPGNSSVVEYFGISSSILSKRNFLFFFSARA